MSPICEVLLNNQPSYFEPYALKGSAAEDRATIRGKVFVFSGMLPLCGGEEGIAAVLGHGTTCR